MALGEARPFELEGRWPFISDFRPFDELEWAVLRAEDFGGAPRPANGLTDIIAYISNTLEAFYYPSSPLS